MWFGLTVLWFLSSVHCSTDANPPLGVVLLNVIQETSCGQQTDGISTCKTPVNGCPVKCSIGKGQLGDVEMQLIANKDNLKKTTKQPKCHHWVVSFINTDIFVYDNFRYVVVISQSQRDWKYQKRSIPRLYPLFFDNCPVTCRKECKLILAMNFISVLKRFTSKMTIFNIQRPAFLVKTIEFFRNVFLLYRMTLKNWILKWITVQSKTRLCGFGWCSKSLSSFRHCC